MRRWLTVLSFALLVASVFGYSPELQPLSPVHPAHDANGNLTNLVSSSANGASVGYEYDALNRLQAVNDAHLGRTAYDYDAVGNLRTSTYPNFVHTEYTYDALNRLTNLASDKLLTALANYAYGVGPAGNRTNATEQLFASVLNTQAKTINRIYTYDDVYRLTGETITVGQAASLSQTYGYDPVGNRLTRNAAFLPAQSFSFDANDWLNTDSYDANGNTLLGGGFGQTQPDQYDLENRLITRQTAAGRVDLWYDGDGNRVKKTVTTATNTVTTFYVVDDQNPTGYAQVMEEHVSLNSQPSTLNRVLTYGHTLISQDRLSGSTWLASFYGYDGHNNVRYLTDVNGFVIDTYDYDAFGNLIAATGNTPNSYLFTGEQCDADLGLYYLRARYHNPDTGRFWTQDSFEGFGSDPSSLHKYTYCGNNPVNACDPSGNFSLVELGHVTAIGGLTTAWTAGIFRALGAASAGAGWKESLDAANEGIGRDFAEGALGGAVGYGLGKAAFWAIGRAAPYLLQYTPTFVMAYNRTTALLGRAWQVAETRWATLEQAIIQGSETAIRSAEAALVQARVAALSLSDAADSWAISSSLRPLNQAGALVRYAEGPSGLRNMAMAVHAKAGNTIAVRNSAVAIAKVRLASGESTYFASGSGGVLRPEQRDLLQRFGIPEDNLLFGSQVKNGFTRLENHAEQIIMRNLPEGAVIEEWGISWAGGQKPIPCENCALNISGRIQY